MSTISVVVPCFNTERHLGAALDSILAQGWPALEVIVIDDGSTDASAQIARAHPVVTLCHSQANGGIARARNEGVRRASGEYLAFLDADDVWTEQSLARRHRALHSQGAACVFGALEQFLDAEADAQLLSRIAFDPRPAVARFAGTMLIRREAFLRAGEFDPALRVGEMVEWVARAEAAGVTIATIEQVVLRRRIHGRNTVLMQKPNRADYLRALKAAMDRRRSAPSAADVIPEASSA